MKPTSARVAGAVMAALLAAVAAGSCAQGARDARLQGPDGLDAAGAAVDAASQRIADLRERFQIAPSIHMPGPSRSGAHALSAHPVIAPGAGVRFETSGGGRVEAVVDPDAKRWVRRSASVELPASADGNVRVVDDGSGVVIAFRLVGASASGLTTTGDGIALYPGAGPGGADVVNRVHAEGTEDFVVFETKPDHEELDYEVDVSQVPGLRLVGNVLEFLAADGTPALRMAPPYVAGQDGRTREARIRVAGCACDVDPSAPWGRAVTAPEAATCGIRVAWSGGAYPAIVDPSWVATGSMTAPRQEHTATLLGSGKVLLAGGVNATGYLSSAELFDGTSTFAATGSMTATRAIHTATLLKSGKVLVVGGVDISGGVPGYLSSAELFDGTSSFTGTGSMTSARARHTATLLGSGKVLVTGGTNYLGDTAVVTLSSAELFDGTSSFAVTGSMTATRELHSATLLGSGKVLVAGGIGPGVLSSAELFDGTSSFAATGSMTAARDSHTATLLPSGKVLVAGGGDANTIFGNTGYLSSAELFDGTSSFTATGSMTAERENHTATLLTSGKVLVVGGDDCYPNGQTCNESGVTAVAEFFDGTSSFAATSVMRTARTAHTATLLSSSKLLVAGGVDDSSSVLSSAEIYDLAPAGATCAAADDCVSAVCANGVCCAGACSGTCTGCAIGTGACGPVTSADDVDNCTGAMTCSATGTCLLKNGRASASASSCASGLVSDGLCCSSACSGACDACAASLGASADGTCTILSAGAAGNPACGNGLACDGTDATCPASPCASDVDCLSGDYCAASGSCTARKAQGASCNTAARADCNVAGCRVCTTGACFDGVCCASASCGSCQACAAALKESGADGTCGPAKAGTNPHADLCATSAAATCGADGQCDGNGGCQIYYPAGVSCGTSACSQTANMAQGQLCNGAGACLANSGTSCDPYLCAAGGCPTGCASDVQCTATAYCTPSHTCAVRLPPGASCTGPDPCASGHCVDGVCCDQACVGQCEACDVAGGAGTCSPVHGAPHGARAACGGADAGPANACAGSCDGTSAAACTYAGATTSCGSTCSGSTLTTSACDGTGRCVPDLPIACSTHLLCAADHATCETTCAADADCAEGFGCSGGACIAKGGAVCSGPHTSTNTTGGAGDAGTSDCDPYVCDNERGSCKIKCASVADCVAPDVCNSSGQCVPTSGATTSSSGGCAAGAAPASGAGWPWIGALAVLVTRRRRARRRADARIQSSRRAPASAKA